MCLKLLDALPGCCSVGWPSCGRPSLLGGRGLGLAAVKLTQAAPDDCFAIGDRGRGLLAGLPRVLAAAALAGMADAWPEMRLSCPPSNDATDAVSSATLTPSAPCTLQGPADPLPALPRVSFLPLRDLSLLPRLRCDVLGSGRMLLVLGSLLMVSCG